MGFIFSNVPRLYGSGKYSTPVLGTIDGVNIECPMLSEHVDCVPVCANCGCPELIADHPEFWECRNCGTKKQMALNVEVETAEQWRPAERTGIIDLFL